MSERIPIKRLRLDGGTQPRAVLNHEVIEEYIESIKAGAKFPPVDVFFDGEHYWLADGFHRCDAFFGADYDEIECTVHQGTLQDAQWFSYAANRTNGLYRSNADKQRAVQAALRHPASAGLSDREIARHVGVHPDTVGQWRKRQEPHLSESDRCAPTRTATRNGTTYEINVSNIGKAQAAPKQDSEPELIEQIHSGPVPARLAIPDSIAPFKRGLGELFTAQALWEEGDERYIVLGDIEDVHEFLDSIIRQCRKAGSDAA